jgi:type IV secretory pathway component VirB8
MEQEVTHTKTECNMFEVYPSKYHVLLSAVCCVLTVAWGFTIAMGVPSKMAVLYVVMVIPAVMGTVPVEETVKSVVSYTRLWELRCTVYN